MNITPDSMDTDQKNEVLREGFLVKRVRQFLWNNTTNIGLIESVWHVVLTISEVSHVQSFLYTLDIRTVSLKEQRVSFFSRNNTHVWLILIIWMQGHLVHNWKARWFVLMSDKLLYYKYEGGKRDSCQRGKILLKDCEITCPFLEYENRPVSYPRRLVVWG